jgi:hypothetical protein
LRDESRLSVFENRLLRKIIGPRKDDETGEWRKLHSEELNDPYFSQNIFGVNTSRIMRWAGHAVRVVERRGSHWVQQGKPEGKPL